MDKTDSYAFYDRQAIIKSRNGISKTTTEIINSDMFNEVLERFLISLKSRDSLLLSILPKELSIKKQVYSLVEIFNELTTKKIGKLDLKKREYKHILKDTYTLSQFVEELYNYWRDYERFFIYFSDEEISTIPKAPYNHFNENVESLNYLVRKTYRDIAFNISGNILRVYRQVPAGCQVGLIVRKEETNLPKTASYSKLKEINFIKQVLIEPPLIISQSNNTRSGEFLRVFSNPLEKFTLESDDWLCYPAKVGDLLIHLYFHNKLISVGTAVANLFDLAGRPEITKKPDAIYVYGVDDKTLLQFKSKTVFYDDEKNNILVAACPRNDEFGYFGYIKKMILTLHNIIMMKRGRMPVHGAMVKISFKNGKTKNVVIWGDTGAGKSETLEAFRTLSKNYLRDIKIIFDDMGSLEITKTSIKGYGTETGAFVRLDDLSKEFAFGSIDRSIIMNPEKTNARAVLPITTMEEVLYGYDIDYILYANNFEQIDNNHQIFEIIDSMEKAIELFKQGPRMAKGTTNEKGLVYSYYANIFGPAQYKEMHDVIAKRFFKKMYDLKKIKVGIVRTRLGIEGFETKGPEEAARALFEAIAKD